MNERAEGYPGTVVTAGSSRDVEFETRLRDSSTLAFRVAFGVLRHRQDAEDVAQDAFARAYVRFNQLRDRDAFRAWLVRTTWRLAIDRRRGEMRRAAREQAVQPAGERSPEDLAAAQERAAHLWTAIDELSPKLRLVLILAAIEGHDVADVSRLLSVPEGTVKSRLFLARKQLAEKLQCLANDSDRR
jgi:RNA polymerase sigma-70 factor (ECF subfamily)